MDNFGVPLARDGFKYVRESGHHNYQLSIINCQLFKDIRFLREVSAVSKTRKNGGSNGSGAPELPRQPLIDEAPIDSNLIELQEMQSELKTEQRAPEKRVGLYTRIRNFFHFNKKFKSGDMTEGENKQRENEYYENFLLAKISYQQGGQTAYQEDPGESIDFAAAEGASMPLNADISAGSISRSRSRGGDAIEAQTDLIYRNKLKLIAAKANFKHRILGGSTAEYSSQNAKLMFMGEFRDLTLTDGVFRILHSYKDDTDNFGEIVGMDFTDGALGVSMNRFLLRDGDASPRMIFNGGAALLAFDDCIAELKNISSEDLTVKSGSVLLIAPADILGKGTGFSLGGTITLSDDGIICENLSQSLGDVKTDLFSGTGASVELARDSDPARKLRVNVHFDKWSYGFNDGRIAVDKRGENGSASMDAQGALRLASPNDIPFYLRIFGRELPLVPKADSSVIVISDNAPDFEFSSERMTILGQSFSNVAIKLRKGGAAAGISFSAGFMGNPDDKVRITDLNGGIGSDGLMINSARIHIDPAANLSSVGSLDANIQNLSVSREGLSFDSVSFDAKTVTLGEDELLKMESVVFTASKPKNAPLSIKADMSNVELNIAPDEGESGFTIETKGAEGAEGFMAGITIEHPLTAAAASQGLAARIKTAGRIVGHYDELMNFWLGDVSIGNDSGDMSVTANQVNVTAFPASGEISLLGGFVKFSEFTASAKKLKLNKRGIVPETGSELCVNVNDLVFADKKIGGVSIEMEGRSFTAKITDVLKDAEVGLGGARLVFNGGLGLRYDAGKTPKIGVALDELKVKLSVGSTEIELEELSEEDDGSIKLGRAAGTFKVPFTDKLFAAEGKGISFDPAAGKLSFERIGGGLTNTGVTVGKFEVKNPKVWLLNNFTGYGLSGECSLKLGEALDASGEICVDLLQEKNYVPSLGPMNNVKVSIPGFGAVSVKTITPDKDNPDSLHFEEIKLNDGEELKTGDPAEDDSLFHKILYSLPKPRVTLDKGDWVNGKFVYDKTHLHYSASSFEFSPIDGLKLTMDFDSKTAAAEYSFTKPDGEWAETSALPELFSKDISFPLPMVWFLSVGGGITGGAGIKFTVKGSVNFAGSEAVLAGGLSVDKAKAYIGLQAFLLIGLPSVANIKIGIEGDLVGTADGSNVQFSLGLKKNPGSDAKIPVTVDGSADKTFFSFGFSANLSARIKAFAKASLFGFFGKKPFTINLKTIELVKAAFSGKANRSSGEWKFAELSKFIASDFNKDFFEQIIQAKIGEQDEALRDIRSIVSDGGAVLGMDERSSEDIFELSAEYVERIFPTLKKIREVNKNAFDTLKTADKNALSSLLKSKKHIAKHETRLAGADMLTADMPEEEKAVYERIAEIKNKTFEPKGKEPQDGGAEAMKANLDKLGNLPPARVLAELSKKIKILFSPRGITEKEYENMMNRYIGIRNMLAEAAENPFRKSGGEYIAVKQSGSGEEKAAQERYKSSAAESSGQSKASDKDMKKLVGNAAENWKKVKDQTKKYNNIISEINALSEALRGKSFSQMDNWIQIKDAPSHSGKENQINDRLADITSKYGITQGDVNKYKKYKELLPKRDKARSELLAARKAINVSEESVSEDFDEEAFTNLRGKVSENLSALAEIKGMRARKIRDSSVDGILASHGEGYMYRVSELKDKFGDYVGTNEDYVTRDELRQLSANALKANAAENTAKYEKLINGAEKREAEKEGQISDTFMKYLFSMHAVNKTENAAGNQQDTNQPDQRSAVKPGAAGAAGMERLQELITYTEGRISAYKDKINGVHDAIAKTEENIKNANNLMKQAADTFNKLNQITPDDFKAEQTGNTAEFKMPAKFSESLNTLIETRDITENKLDKNDLNSLLKASDDAQQNARTASDALNALNEEEERTA